MIIGRKNIIYMSLAAALFFAHFADAASDLTVPVVTEYSLVRQKNDAYEDAKKQLQGQIVDKPSEILLRNVLAEKTANYPDNIAIKINFSTEELLKTFADQLSKQIALNAGKVFWVGKNFSCSNPAAKFAIKDLNGTTGTLTAESIIEKPCRICTQTLGCQNNNLWGKTELAFSIKPEPGKSIFSLEKFDTSSSGSRIPFLPSSDGIHEDVLVALIKKSLPNAETTAMNEYRSLISSTVLDVSIKLRNRYSKSNSGLLKTEKIYNLSFDIAVARLQRTLDKFKYEKDQSTFFFEESLNIGNKMLKRKTLVKLFPESNNRVAVVIDMSYETLTDSLSKEVYGENESRTSFDSTIASITKLLSRT